MPVPENALFALAAAASWGGGDFSGGMGVKAAGGTATGALRLVIVAHAASLAVLTVLCVVSRTPWPHGAAMVWALGAGTAVGVSLTAFYISLSRGAMGVSAAVSGVLAAAIPAVVSMATEGAPGSLRLAGFALALAAIWVIAAGDSPENAPEDKSAGRKTMGLAIVGGLGFGFYFVALRMSNGLGVMEPIALARAASLVTCLVLLAIISWHGKSSPLLPTSQNRDDHPSEQMRSPGTPDVGHPAAWLSREAVGWAMGVALLDTGGNLLLVAATRTGRLDVAAVLASLYTAATILLAAWRLHEHPTKRQLAGMVAALVAVVMITI
jgi:drug/metabolite transporter (DMT)-like permease